MGLRKSNVVENAVAEESVVEIQQSEVLEDVTQEAPVQTQPAPATMPATTGSSLPASNSAAGAIDELAQQGFAGLGLDFSSFVGIVLNGNFITTDNQEIDSRDGFGIRIQATRPKFAYRSNHVSDDDVEVVYSYDANAAKDPHSPVSVKIAEWQQEGADVGEVKEYLEVWGLMEDDGDLGGTLNDQLVTLSIPPTSKGRLSGFLTTQFMKGHRNPTDFVTVCKAGKKIGGANVRHAFTPWAFEMAV